MNDCKCKVQQYKLCCCFDKTLSKKCEVTEVLQTVQLVRQKGHQADVVRPLLGSSNGALRVC